MLYGFQSKIYRCRECCKDKDIPKRRNDIECRYRPTQEVRIREILFSNAFCPKSETVNVNQSEADDDAEKNAEEHLKADNDEQRVQDLVLLEEKCSQQEEQGGAGRVNPH